MQGRVVSEIDVDSIKPFLDRERSKEEFIKLVDSIRSHGLINPIIVTAIIKKKKRKQAKQSKDDMYYYELVWTKCCAAALSVDVWFILHVPL